MAHWGLNLWLRNAWNNYTRAAIARAALRDDFEKQTANARKAVAEIENRLHALEAHDDHKATLLVRLEIAGIDHAPPEKLRMHLDAAMKDFEKIPGIILDGSRAIPSYRLKNIIYSMFKGMGPEHQRAFQAREKILTVENMLESITRETETVASPQSLSEPQIHFQS